MDFDSSPRGAVLRAKRDGSRQRLAPLKSLSSDAEAPEAAIG